MKTFGKIFKILPLSDFSLQIDETLPFSISVVKASVPRKCDFWELPR